MHVAGQVDVERKRAAVQEVLASSTFARSGQLKAFLTYICDRALEGREDEITEYLIGIRALGRPEGFSPVEDSTVRNRARALREKLQEYYECEAPGSTLRIDLAKGTYIPRFAVAEELVLQPQPDVLRGRSSSKLWPAVIVAAVLGVVLLSALVVTLRRDVVAEAWGPLAVKGSNVLLCAGSELFMVVHSHPYWVPDNVQKHPAPPQALEVWMRHRPAPSAPLTMHLHDGSMTVGEARALATAASTLTSFGANWSMMMEQSVPLVSLRQRNAIIVGNPQYSNLVAKAMEGLPFLIEFDQESRDLIVRERDGQRRIFRPQRSAEGYINAYALLSVRRSEGSDGRQRTVIASGTTALGSQASLEYFSSAEHLLALERELRQAGLKEFPATYQVVLRCKADRYQLLSFELAGWRDGSVPAHPGKTSIRPN